MTVMSPAGCWEWATRRARQPGQYIVVAGGICTGGHDEEKGHHELGVGSTSGNEEHHIDCKAERWAHHSQCKVVGEAHTDAPGHIGRDAKRP